MTSTEGFIMEFVDDILTEISSSAHQGKEKQPNKEVKDNRPLSKLELYKSRQFYCQESDLHIYEKDGSDELMTCPLCLLLTKKSEYTKHCKRSERHSSYLQIEDLYLTYCDRRRINPVSCNVQELQSFIQRLEWRPEENILPVWIYLASRHEADLTSFDAVRAVLESPLRRRRSHQICPTEDSMPDLYACYSCPYFCKTAQELLRHVHGEEHASAMKQWNSRGKNYNNVQPNIFTNLFCDYCDEEFLHEASLRLHRFGRKHLGGGRLNTKKLHPCYLCDTDKDININNHITEIEHCEKESMADGFLIFCYQNGFEIPLKISPESLIGFLETLPVASLIPNVKLLRRLFGSDDNPNCPLNDKKLRIFISYTELSGSIYSPELPNKVIDLLTRCSFEEEKCSDTRFDRTTKLFYHSVSVHMVSPTDLLKELLQKIENEELRCEKKNNCCKECHNKSFISSLVYALHKDAHESRIECEHCMLQYKSVVEYCFKDDCGENNVVQSTKNLVDQMIKTVLLTSEIEHPLLIEKQSNKNFKDCHVKKRKRACSSDATDEEGLVGHWLLNCPNVRARKISVASRKKVDDDDSDNSENSVRSSKIVLNGSPQILPESEDEKDINGNLRKKPRLVHTSLPVEKPLRKRLSDKMLNPSLKSQRSENGSKSVKSDTNVRSCRILPTKEAVDPHKKSALDKKLTPRTLQKYLNPRTSPALTNSGLPLTRQNSKSKLNSSKILFKKDDKGLLSTQMNKIRSPNLNNSKSETNELRYSQVKPRLPIPLKSRKCDVATKIKPVDTMAKKYEIKKVSYTTDKVCRSQQIKNLNETITKTSNESADSDGPTISRSSTFVKNEIDDADPESQSNLKRVKGSHESLLFASSPKRLSTKLKSASVERIDLHTKEKLLRN
ncbi:uncharacterized protein [Lepeophtheirus salmonis]|uniref:uncharacterized protein isoform X1 n=1 Tax=Lepeophtheirus salmonis TaxID=72036 RepID=UPI001AE1F73F|nr:uncharacterized protein LOC121114226 isoform X1 [Lepeophtheirus salmonis]